MLMGKGRPKVRGSRANRDSVLYTPPGPLTQPPAPPFDHTPRPQHTPKYTARGPGFRLIPRLRRLIPFKYTERSLFLLLLCSLGGAPALGGPSPDLRLPGAASPRHMHFGPGRRSFRPLVDTGSQPRRPATRTRRPNRMEGLRKIT